jgi:peptide deformylase
MLRRLIPWNSPILREPLPPFDFTKHTKEAIDTFVDEMFAACKAYNGLGLSANQVGVDYRMFVVRIEHNGESFDKSVNFKQAYFNPSILASGEEMDEIEEGCLSRPGLWLKVKRPKVIRVRYWNQEGEQKDEMLDGILARAFQHEYDHMEGLDFTDRISPLKLQMAKKKKEKAKKKLAKYLADRKQVLVPRAA